MNILKNLKFKFQQLSVRDVTKILKKLKKSRSSGLDDISSEAIRPVIDEIAPALTSVINSSLREGIFPSEYKCAKVICVFKGKGAREDPGCYRPISNLALFGKCQEVAVDMQLRKFCEKYNLFGSHQHGFRKARSTTTALLTAITRWRSERSKKFRGVLFFDLSAAYDTLSMELFAEKAKIFGIEGSELAWFRSYLSDHSQVVQVNQAIRSLRW